MATKSADTKTTWLYVSLAGLFLFIVLFILLMMFGKEINLTTPVYFFLVVIIGLVATGFLSGAMRSVAKYNASFNNKTLSVTGPAVIFFIILYIGFKYKPEQVQNAQPLSLSVLVTGEGGVNDLIRNGSMELRIGDINYTEKINDKGIAYFSGINPVYKGEKIELFPQVEGYVIDTASDSYGLNKETAYTNLTIHLKKATTQIAVNGKVVDVENQEGITDAIVQFEGMDSLYRTNEVGNFSALLPVKTGTELRVIVTRKNKIVYNSMRTVADKSILILPVKQ
jgi:hypothetical protein